MYGVSTLYDKASEAHSTAERKNSFDAEEYPGSHGGGGGHGGEIQQKEMAI